MMLSHYYRVLELSVAHGTGVPQHELVLLCAGAARNAMPRGVCRQQRAPRHRAHGELSRAPGTCRHPAQNIKSSKYNRASFSQELGLTD